MWILHAFMISSETFTPARFVGAELVSTEGSFGGFLAQPERVMANAARSNAVVRRMRDLQSNASILVLSRLVSSFSIMRLMDIGPSLSRTSERPSGHVR